MAKLGSKKRPIIVRVNTEDAAEYVATTCEEHGWSYLIGFEGDKPEDISYLDKMLNPLMPAISQKQVETPPVRVEVEKNTRNAVV